MIRPFSDTVGEKLFSVNSHGSRYAENSLAVGQEFAESILRYYGKELEPCFR
jgi:hypothetical protein